MNKTTNIEELNTYLKNCPKVEAKNFTFESIFIFIGLGLTNMIMLPLFFSGAIFIASMFLMTYCFYFAGGMLVIAPVLDYIAPSYVSGSFPMTLLMTPFGFLFIMLANYLLGFFRAMRNKFFKFGIQYIASDFFLGKFVES